jgi:mRNA degradation ribonuclease J1/J2
MDVQYGDGNTDIVVVPIRAVDYRNTRRMNPHTDDDDVYVEYNATNPSFIPHSHGSNTRTSSSSSSAEANDVNDRGRGRTVETQGSGLAVVRAMWEFRRWYGEDGV